MTGSSEAAPGRLAALVIRHEGLATIVQRVADMCDTLESGSTAVDPAAVITELELGLWRHFAAEEADDYFGAVTRERPSLLPGISELKAEHATLFRAVASLRTLAADKSHRAEVATSARRLLSELKRHEDRENRLLQDLVLRDEGAVQD